MQQQSKMQVKDFKPSDQCFQVTVEHADSIITTSPTEEANQRSSSLPAASTATSSQPTIIPQPPGLQIPPGFQIQPQQPQQSGLSQPQAPQQAPQAQPQQQVRRRIRTKSRPQESSEIAVVLQDIKENHLSVGRDQVNADRKLNQRKSYFKVSFFRSGIKGIFRGIQQIRSRKHSQKSSSRLVLMVMMPMIQFLLVNSVKKNVDPSLSQGGS